MNERRPARLRHVPSVAELILVLELRGEAEREFAAQFHADHFLDWSRLARRANWRTILALHIEGHGAGWTLGWIGSKALDSDDQAFWDEAIPRIRAVTRE